MHIDISSELFSIVSQKNSRFRRVVRARGLEEDDSAFVASAKQIQEDIENIGGEVMQFVKHFLRVSNSGLSSSYLIDSDESSLDIQNRLEQASKNIESLQKLLQQVEKDTKPQNNSNRASADVDQTMLISSHQRAHYHAILISLFEKFQGVSKKFQIVRLMQQENERMQKSLFQPELVDEHEAERIARAYYERKNSKSIQTQRQQQATKPTHKQTSFKSQQHIVEQDRSATVHADADVSREDWQTQIPSEMQQQLEMENRMVFLELDSMVEDVREAERKAVQVTELITMFESKVAEEQEMIDQLYENAQQAHTYLESASSQLKKAEDKASNSMFRYFFAYLFLFASLLLLGLHGINAEQPISNAPSIRYHWLQPSDVMDYTG